MARAGKGKVAGSEFNLGADSDQLRLMERLNLPFLNISCDELPLVKGKSPGGQGSTPGNASNKNKRPMVDAHQDPNKKRFVWPDALHRDFLAAVFDIGLKYASPKEVAQLLAEDDNTVSMDQMKSHIQKFMMFRERKEGDYVPYFDQERGVLPSRPSFASGGSYETSSQANAAPASNAINNNFGDMASNIIRSEAGWSENGSVVASVSHKDTSKDIHDKRATARPYQSRPTTSIPPAILLAKIDSMGEAINAQSAHLANIKQLIKRQTKLFVLLSQKAAQLKATLPNDVPNPLTYNAFLDNGVRNTCSTLYPMNIVTGDSTFGLSYIDTTQKNLYNDSFNYNYTNNAPSNSEGVVNLNYLRHSGNSNNTDNTRSGFQVMSEMREHMDTHRKLLLRKEDQLSQHGYISDRYVHDDGCTSGYNRFTDQYNYKEYVYTDEDNRLCYPNGIKTADSKNSAYGITGMGRANPANALAHPITTVYPNQHYVSQTTGLTSGNSSVRSGKSGRSRIDGIDTSNMLGYFYNVSQATKAAHGSTVRSQSTAHPSNNGIIATGGALNGTANGVTNGNYTSAANGNIMAHNPGSAPNGIANGIANGITNGATNGTTNGATNGVTNGFYRASSENNTTTYVPPAYAFNNPALPLPSNGTSTSTSATTTNNNNNNLTEPADWETELDLESDLFSFLFDPSQA